MKRESEDLMKELVVFLEGKTKAKVETTENEIIVKGKVASKKWVLQTLIRDFMQEAGIKGKIKRGCGKTS